MTKTLNATLKHHKFFASLIFCAFYIVISTPLILKTLLIEQTIYSLSDQRFLGLIEAIKSNILIHLSLLLLLYCSLTPKCNKITTILYKLAIIIIFFTQLIDYFVILNFGNKLSLEDITKYGSYSLKYLMQIYDHDIYFAALFFLILSSFILYFGFKHYKIKPNRALNVTIIAIILGFCALFILPKSQKNKFKHYEILLKYTASDSSKNLNYSPEFIKNFTFNDTQTCYPSTKNSPNIIILMVESLSSYHSKFFSNLHNLTPNIDKIAKQNIAFTNFYANGSFTENGELALLTGLASIKPPRKKIIREYCFNGFFALTSSLPNILKKHHYHSEFLTTSTLDFSDTGKWTKSIGFDYQEDSSHPYYQNYESFVFDSRADEHLLNRVLQRQKNTRKPTFTFIKTVSSHIPYTHPRTKIDSEFYTIKYVDEEIGKFYDKLKKSHFFDNGILIITGDHHTSQTPKKDEVQRYGYVKSQAMVPMILVMKDKKPQIITEQFQQADIYNSIKNLISNQSCHSNWHGDIFHPQHHPKYVIFKREDRKHIVTIFEQEKMHEIMLNGDNTKILNNNNLTKEEAQYLIDKINNQRINPPK